MHARAPGTGTLIRLGLSLALASAGAAAQASLYGSGCAGNNPAPAISHTGSTTPGVTGTVHLTGAPPGGLTVVLVGTSNTFYGAIPLPFDLSGVAGVHAGCALLAAPSIKLPVVASPAGTVNFSFKNPSGLGPDLYFQGVVFESTSPNSITLTEGLHLHLTSVVTPASTALDFGSTAIGATAATQHLQLTNDTSLPATITNAVVFDRAAADYDASLSLPTPFTLAPGDSASVDVSFHPTAAGLRSATLQVQQSGLPLGFQPVSIELSGVGLGPPGSDVLLNAGGGDYMDGQGQLWSADFGASGGSVQVFGGAISGTADPELYQTYREGADFSYGFALPDGLYGVTLRFAEPSATAAGQRVFDVLLEGGLAADDVDLFALAGAGAAYSITAPVTVSDGHLDLELAGSVGDALLSALEVRLLFPVLVAAPAAMDFGALATGSVASQPASLQNTGTAPLVLDSIEFKVGPGGGAGHEFVVDIDGTEYTGEDFDVTVPAALELAPGQLQPISIAFAPTEHMANDVAVIFHGNFAPEPIALQGTGGAAGSPYLHVVMEVPPISVDYDGAGFVDVALDGSGSHTHQQGHELDTFVWKEGATVIGTAPLITSPFALGSHTVSLTIGDDNIPPLQLTGSADLQVVAKDSVPGVLALYYPSGGTPPVNLLDAVPANASYAELLDQLLVTDQGGIGGSPYSEHVMVRLLATLRVVTRCYCNFELTGGTGTRLFVDGVPWVPHPLGSGLHTLEARFAVDSLANLPLEVTEAELDGIPLPIDGSLLVHDETALKPVINAMPSQGITLGGNAITIDGLGFFPASDVKVHWGPQLILPSSFTSQTPQSLSFLSPAHANGFIAVSVETPQGTSNTLPFEYLTNGTPPITFTEVLPTTAVSKPTCAAWGPDGRLYVATISGRLWALSYDDANHVTNVASYLGLSTLDNDDTLGIAFNPYDPPDPVRVYVGHGQIYAHNGGGSFTEPSPYTGAVSVLTGPDFNGGTPLITGLPVSNHDHAINGLQFDDNGDLYIAVGSDTNAGVKWPPMGDQPESPLSAAILKAETSRPDFNGAISYVDTIGGLPDNDQKFGEQVSVAPGSHVSVHAPGIRNAYGIVYTTKRHLYASDNGPNSTFGPASTGATTQTSDPTTPDELLLVEFDNYYGHANRSRGRFDPRENVFHDTLGPSIPHVFRQSILTFSSGSGGLSEYRADTFLGQMRGNLLVQRWNNNTRRVLLSADGRSVTGNQNLTPSLSPLDVVPGPGGTILGIDYTTDEVHLMQPVDLAATGLTVYDIFPWRAPSTGGQPFVIGGAHFGTLGNTTVTIGGLPAALDAVSATRIHGVLPANTGPTMNLLDVTVTSGAQSDTLPAAFRYLPGTPGNAPGFWETGPSLPQAVNEVACGEINGILYLVGGGTFKTYALDPDTNAWAQKSNRPFAGTHHAAEVFHSRLYLIGGLLNGAEGKVQIYDPPTNSWSTGADMPWPGGSVSTALIDGQIYAAGGISGSTTVDFCAAYDPVLNQWTPKASAPPLAGRNHAAAATDGQRLFIFGGRGVGSGPDNNVANGFDSVEIYDPATDTWITSLDLSGPGAALAPLPIARGGMGKAVFYKDEFYVMGGETDTGPGATPQHTYNRVDVYNPATNTWRLEALMPTARHGIFPILYQSRMYVAGGGTSAGLSQTAVCEIFTRQ